jgi:hypothetical protein
MDEFHATSRMPIAAKSFTVHSTNSVDHRIAFVNTANGVDATAQKGGSGVMLSMSTAESKKRLTALVSGAYAMIWALLFLTHDKGEKSE